MYYGKNKRSSVIKRQERGKEMQENVSKQRDISYDILRILLCVFVIAKS